MAGLAGLSGLHSLSIRPTMASGSTEGGLNDGEIEIVRTGVTIDRLRAMAETGFGDLVKAVVDVDSGVMAIGGTMHADEEAVLMDLGCNQADLWGINLYPGQFGDADWIEFDSMINVRPGQGNRSRDVEDVEIRRRIAGIVIGLVHGG